MKNPSRCFLPIVKSTILNENEKKITATTMLDSGNELNIMNSRLCDELKLRGDEITIDMVGVAGEIIRKKTKIVEVTVEDRMGYKTQIQCIVLDKACGNAISVDPKVVSHLRKKTIPKDIYMEGGEIELLIGMSAPRLHQQISIWRRRGNNDYGDSIWTLVSQKNTRRL